MIITHHHLVPNSQCSPLSSPSLTIALMRDSLMLRSVCKAVERLLGQPLPLSLLFKQELQQVTPSPYSPQCVELLNLFSLTHSW